MAQEVHGWRNRGASTCAEAQHPTTNKGADAGGQGSYVDCSVNSATVAKKLAARSPTAGSIGLL